MDSIKQLRQKINSARSKLNIEKATKELKSISELMSKPDFWSDSSKAQSLSQKHAKLEKRVAPWNEMNAKLTELEQLSAMKDDSLSEEITQQLKVLERDYEKLEKSLRFGGPYDDHDAIITLQAGAGGKDAQDWAQILERMYLRWAEKSQLKTKLIDESKGEEAGIKSATMQIAGDNVYGKLRGEHGVHRLVRLSPFNSAHSRETSFAMVEILPEIDQSDEVVIDDKDLRVDVFRAGGHGGQSVNTTDSAVRITHVPTGVVVSIQNEKSQIQNRETAMKILRSRLASLQIEQQKEEISQLRGPNKETAWGNQIRNYVMHPYTLVKDSRSGYETTDIDSVLGGDLDELIETNLSL